MKTELRISNTALTLLLGVKVLFRQKTLFFCKKMLTSAKLRRPRHQKTYFPKVNMGVYLCVKFEVSSIILTNFRQGGCNFTPHLKTNP